MTTHCRSEHSLPASIYKSLALWVEHGAMPGGFLRSCLENDLVGAINRADPESLAALRQIVTYIYWEVPGNCWGSPEKVAAWRRRKGDERELAERESRAPTAPAIDMDVAPCALCQSKEHGAIACPHVPHGSLDL